jgi:hypothetical protein
MLGGRGLLKEQNIRKQKYNHGLRCLRSTPGVVVVIDVLSALL